MIGTATLVFAVGVTINKLFNISDVIFFTSKIRVPTSTVKAVLVHPVIDV